MKNSNKKEIDGVKLLGTLIGKFSVYLFGAWLLMLLLGVLFNNGIGIALGYWTSFVVYALARIIWVSFQKTQVDIYK